VKKIEITMKIVTFVVPAAEFISIVLNIFVAIFPLRILGAVISIVGVLAFILSVLTMRDSWRAGVSKTDQTELITGGIYQISRNPAFLGFDLVYIGMVMMFFNLPLLILSVVAMIIFHLQIVNVEEDFLLETFGDDYIDYKKKVCRYLGRKQ
ncbi:MAG: methyltransferase family protein, partial [Eisenbergiella sp.]